MSAIYFLSDLHLGHQNILNFSPDRDGKTVDEHDEILIQKISATVKRRDTLYLLGDIAFQIEKLEMLRRIPGKKILVRGNHDRFQTGVYMKYFSEVEGLISKYKFWLSHAPVHPDELRGKENIHGHVHDKPIKVQSSNSMPTDINDNRYINVCVEATSGYPLSLEQIRHKINPTIF